MSVEEMIVALVGAIGAFALVGYLSAKVFGLIKAWINRNSNSIPEEAFDRLAKAFMEHKKNTERRLKNLEAIISEDESISKSEHRNESKQIEAPKETIEIEDPETTEEESQSDSDPNLRNMLRE
jgi:hypothetical protein